MTNTEEVPTQPEFPESPIVSYVDTLPTYEAELTGTIFRFLNWINGIQDKAFHVNLPGFSPERQAGVRALVDQGLVTERRWTTGEYDGRVTYRVTELGRERLEAAWSAADLVVMG